MSSADGAASGNERRADGSRAAASSPLAAGGQRPDGEGKLYDKFFANFIVKNLDTGETFHVDQIESFLEESSLLTFEGASASGWNVSVPEVKQFGLEKDAGYKPFTAYKIYVTNPNIVKNRRTFSIFRRYSEFVKLDKSLREGGWADRIKLSLPNKRWFNNLSLAVVKKRQAALEAYLNTLLHYLNPAEVSPLDEFFSTTPTRAKLLSPPTSPLVSPRFLTLAEATEEFGLLPPPEKKGNRGN